MPFTQTHEVLKGFLNFFMLDATKKTIEGDNRQHPMIPIKLHSRDDVVDFMLRYFKRSGDSGVEGLMDYYPCIVVQDFQPEVDRTQMFGRPYLEGVIDELRGKREIVYFPIPLIYKFQVSGVTRRLRDIHSCNDWFMQKFDFDGAGYIMFNQIDTEEGVVGDVVPYEVEFSEIPREDGRFEYSYTFSLNTYLHAKAKNSTFVIPDGGEISDGEFQGGNFGDIIESIAISLEQQDYAKVKQSITENFELSTKPTDNTGIIIEDEDPVIVENGIDWLQVSW